MTTKEPAVKEAEPIDHHPFLDNGAGKCRNLVGEHVCGKAEDDPVHEGSFTGYEKEPTTEAEKVEASIKQRDEHNQEVHSQHGTEQQHAANHEKKK